MTKKYYYTCPIQALYMTKEFGVKFFFKYDDGGTLAIRGINNFLACIDFPVKEIKFYVAKESEGLFLANSEDMIIITEESKREIIMRDSKHFFSPLIETNNA